MSEALLRDVVADLWASFRYDSPEHHAPILVEMISKGMIQEFLDDLKGIKSRRQLREKWGGRLHE